MTTRAGQSGTAGGVSDHHVQVITLISGQASE
jgi:hypothetical protein